MDKKIIIITLGDLIDRGPDSIKAIDIAMKGIKINGADITYESLMGNHEQFLLGCMLGGDSEINDPYNWVSNGGNAVLENLNLVEDAWTRKSFPSMLRRSLGTDRIEFLENLKSHIRIGDILFIHAGVNPDCDLNEWLSKPWSEYSRDHWLWIRGPFLEHNSNYPDDVVVVHGHTIQENVKITPHRVSVDIGTVFGYNKSIGCVLIDKNNVEIIKTD